MNVFTRLTSKSLKLLACVMLLLPLWAHAQGAPAIPAGDQQAISAYALDQDVFDRLIAASNEAKAAHIQAQPTDMSKVHSLDDLAAQVVSSNPQLAAVVRKHGFTPREFMLANLAMMNAGAAVAAKSNPELAKHIDQSRTNPANVSFYEAHQAQIEKLSRQDEQPGQ
jgi:hypothetical protein